MFSTQALVWNTASILSHIPLFLANTSRNDNFQAAYSNIKII